MRPAAALLLLVLPAALAGCGAPDRALPGVRFETEIRDAFQCGALVFPNGCPAVRLPHTESGCAPEAGGYVVCNGTLGWTATSGAAVPGSRLDMRVGGEPAGSCEPAPGAPCALRGNTTFERRFGGPGEKDEWAMDFVATLTSPAGSPHAGGTFSLAVEVTLRTEGEEELVE